MVIDRVSVKQKSKEMIRISKPSMISAGLIFTLFAALVGYLSLRLTGVDVDTMMKIMQASADGRSEAAMNLLMKATPGAGETLIDVLLHLAIGVVGVGMTLFALNTVRGTNPQIGNLLDGFGMMPRLLFLLILEYIFIFLWSLLFFVPGIIAAYRYSLAVYIMIDHPEFSAMDCLRESKRMTTGYKGQIFQLDLSFLPWLILSAMPVVGYAVQIYLTPYMETAKALYYEKIRMHDEQVLPEM
ncbi:MAG: DUF975 family protein [Oscillospiraceae bacterium]|nr:DUF975 family protein [Oscillospiraceae bacterium]